MHTQDAIHRRNKTTCFQLVRSAVGRKKEGKKKLNKIIKTKELLWGPVVPTNLNGFFDQPYLWPPTSPAWSLPEPRCNCACLQACLQGGPWTCTVGSLPPVQAPCTYVVARLWLLLPEGLWTQGLALSPAPPPAAPSSALWLDPGLGLLSVWGCRWVFLPAPVSACCVQTL